MTHPQTNVHEQGSNPGAAKVLLGLVLGSVLLGGFWSLLGPGGRLVGTWQSTEGESFDVQRFDADGSYWIRSTSGLLSAHLVGTYEVLRSSGDTYRVRIKTQVGKGEMEYRLESPDRLVGFKSQRPDQKYAYTRVGDWVQAMRPSASVSTYDGARPHLGCWQRQSASTPALELREDGVLLRHSGGEAEKSTYSVDYSQVPFHFDVTDAEGRVDREIFDFTADGALRISQTHLGDGARPAEMNRFQAYFPCPESDSQGDA